MKQGRATSVPIQTPPILMSLFALALFPVASIFASNLGEAQLQSVAQAALASVFLTLLVFVILRLLLRRTLTASLATVLFVFLFFSYGHLHSVLLEPLKIWGGFEVEFEMLKVHQKMAEWLHIPLTFLYALGLFVGIKGLLRADDASKVFGTVSTILPLFAACLLIPPIGQLGWYYGKHALSDSNVALKSREVQPATELRLGYAPDIYYLILDGYARSDVLRSVYGFDNGAFLNALRDTGFSVVGDAMSNYAWTFFSLASSLNMRYLDSVVAQVGEDSTDLRLAYKLLKDNEVVQRLKGRGYKIVHLRTSWSGTQSNPHSDIEIGYDFGMFDDEFLRVFARTTWLKAFEFAMTKNLAASHLANFEALSGIAKRVSSRDGAPLFVFAHILLPHHPFLFDADGNVKRNADLSTSFQIDGWDNRSEYLEQLKFVNREMRGVVDSILRDSARPPVVVIQSDHGPKVVTKGMGETEESFRRQVESRMAIFMAAHLPGGAVLPSGLTPVNLFRTLFNFYFNESNPLLENRAYYSKLRRPYKFVATLTSAPVNEISGNELR